MATKLGVGGPPFPVGHTLLLPGNYGLRKVGDERWELIYAHRLVTGVLVSFDASLSHPGGTLDTEVEHLRSDLCAAHYLREPTKED
jgi:hypothetical protein